MFSVQLGMLPEEVPLQRGMNEKQIKAEHFSKKKEPLVVCKESPKAF
jgi:hypothetical protein